MTIKYLEYPLLHNGKLIKCGIKYCRHYASEEVPGGWICKMHQELLGKVHLSAYGKKQSNIMSEVLSTKVADQEGSA